MFIEKYESQGEAARVNSVKKDSIQRAVKGGYKVGDYYYSDKLEESFTKHETISLKDCVLYLYDFDGNYVKTLSSKSEILNFFNIKTLSTVQQALRTGRQYKNYQLSIEKVQSMEPIIDKRNASKKVGQYTLTGELVTTYDTVTSARKVHGAGVSRCLKGQQKQCHNFIFKYI